jgi:hypothetical protein
MLKLGFALLLLSSVALAQSSSDGSFTVRHFKDADFSLKPSEMQEAESIYRSVCEVVQREYHPSSVGVHPHFTVVIGTKADEVHSHRLELAEIWMTKWDPVVFTQGAVIIAFDQMLTRDLISQMGKRALRQSSAVVNVSGLK